MIGHCCDCLGGKLNCLASTCWLIVISKGQSCTIDCALAHNYGYIFLVLSTVVVVRLVASGCLSIVDVVFVVEFVL